jgi:hypothetical protein
VLENVSKLNPKVRELVKETLVENFKKSNYIRIYPTKTSDIYDKFFAHKPLNIALHKALFSSDVVPYPNSFVQ